MAEPTKGPWHLEKRSHGYDLVVDGESGAHSYGGRIVVLYCLEHDAEFEANVAVLAASWEMREALRLAESSLDNSLRSAGSSVAGFLASRKLMAKAQKAVLAALAKAAPQP